MRLQPQFVISTIKNIIKLQEILIKSQDEMKEFAQKFASSFQNSNLKIIGLKGSLGAGKTFFAKEFINYLQKNKQEILSPTFNIVLSYENEFGKIFHFDLYRIKNFADLENIGFFENLKEGICIIEWPEIAEKYLKKLKNYTEIQIEITNQEQRKITIKNF